MLFRTSGVLIACLSIATPAWAELEYEVAWQVKGEVGFSGANEIRDPATGKTRSLVACEVDRGVVCFSPDGTRKWDYAMTPPVTAAPAVADVDGDGTEDVVACDAAGRIVLLSAEGKLKWTARAPASVVARSCPAVADLDGDGKPEILVGDQSGCVSCFDSAGRLRWRFQGEGTQMGPTLVADIYDHPGAEVIVTSHDHHIYALSAQGEWLWDLYRDDDLFPGSTPMLADVDGDDVPELYLGGGLHHFYRIDPATHRIVLEENVLLHVNSAVCATDFDGDGRDEIIFGDKGATARCYGKDGFRWERSFASGTMSAPALAIDLDGDPDLEVLFIFTTIQALDTDGTVLADAGGPGAANSSPLAGDFDSDGRLDTIVSGHGMFGSRTLAYLKWNVPYRDDPRAWTTLAANRAHTCRVRAARDFRPAATPKRTTGTSDATFTAYGDTKLLSGSNTWRFDVANPGNDRLLLLTEIRHPDGSVHRFARHTNTPKQRAVLSFDVRQAGSYRVKQTLMNADRLAVVSSTETERTYEGLASDAKYLNDAVFHETAKAVSQWGKTNPAAAGHARSELHALRGRFAVLQQAADRSDTDTVTTLRESALRLRSLATAGPALAPTGSFFAWAFCPWAYFNPEATLPTGQDRTERIRTALCVGEYESVALNVTNVSAHTLEVRVVAGDLVGKKTFPAAAHLALRRAVTVSSIRRKPVADALPLLDQAQLLTVGPLETEQLWITVNANGLAPGDYVADLHLRSIEPDSTDAHIPLDIRVYDLALPKQSPLRFCVWAYSASAPDYEVQDLVDHGVNVHFGAAPKAKCNADGELVGKLDFAAHDATVQRFAPHGLIMFIGAQGGLSGQPFLSDPWRKAFVAYLRAWVKHMKTLGLGYEDWALYPYDEPSTPHAKTTLNLVEVAKVVRQADPEILIYTDPTSGTTMKSVEMLTGLIDIWCPSSELLERLGDELIPAAKRVGKHVWFYDAAGGARTLSCLGIYRWRFWYAWNLGLTGAGWWTYAYGDHLWDSTNPAGDYYSTVYRAPGAIVTSKRWEVAREGIEDYEILHLLKDAIRRAKEKQISDPAVAEAEQLLRTLPVTVEAALHDTGRRLPLTPDSVPTYTHATSVLQDARSKIIEACIRLNGLTE